LTGTFGGSLNNSSFNRAYPFSYTISAANTWEQKTVTIAGDTTGTWQTGNSTGVHLYFNLGAGATFSGTAGAWAASGAVSATGATSVVGTNGATFYITGVQLEKGSVATPFEFRSIGTELGLCQRYYFRIKAEAANRGLSSSAQAVSGTSLIANTPFPVTMRVRPTAVEQNGTAGDYRCLNAASSTINCNVVPSFDGLTSEYAGSTFAGVASGLVAGDATVLLSTNANAYLGWSAEL
jgi:hypothetical protein